MAHYAVLDENNIVVQLKTACDENVWDGEVEWEKETGLVHKRTSYNTRGGVYYTPNTNEPSSDQSKSFRKNYAGIGYTYDETRDAFISQKPYPSWALNEESCLWNSPVPHPNDGKRYAWNEETQSWDLMEQ